MYLVSGQLSLRIDHTVLRLRWLLGTTLTLKVIDFLGRLRIYLGMPSFGGREERGWVIEQLSKERSDSNVVDIGASESLLRLQLKMRKIYHTIYTLDVRFMKGLDSKPFILGDGMKLPFRDCSFDVVVLGSMIEHVGLGVYGDPINKVGDSMMLAEVRRILRVGGKVLLTTPYSSDGGVTWQRHYSDAMIENLIKGFILLNKTYLVNQGAWGHPWTRVNNPNALPYIECKNPAKGIVCLILEKPC
jgi:SAM-dependent methyltransferase